MLGQSSISDGPVAMPISVIRMQVAALLEEQKDDHEAQIEKGSLVVQEVTRLLSSLPRIEPVLAHELKSTLDRNGPQVRIPFPTVQPSEVAKHRYAFMPPVEVKVVGSFALQTLIREDAAPLIDIVITMPRSLLEAKDYLDYRYFHKKAYYLACVAQGLLSNPRRSFEIQYAYQDGNELQPSVILTFPSEHSKKKQRWRQARILVGPPQDLFRPDKLRPWMQCLRGSSLPDKKPQPSDIQTNSLYNGTIASEQLSGVYLTVLQHATTDFSGFRDACKLGKIWLRQRDFSSTISGGGFGAFEFSILLALLLREEQNNGTAFFSSEGDGYQLFKFLIQTVASRDVIAKPVTLGKLPDGALNNVEVGVPFFYDSQREHNLLFKMSISSWELLKTEARSTLNALMQADPYKFYPTFIARLGGDPFRFDHVIYCSLTVDSSMLLQKVNQLHKTLTSALRDRVLLINIQIQPEHISNKWPCNSLPPKQSVKNSIQIGILTDSIQIARRVDLGPLAEEKEAASRYRDFWGTKAELRRFTNGEIRESVTWPAASSDSDILNLIVSHILHKHFPNGKATASEFRSDEFTRLINPQVPTSQALLAFAPIEAAFAKLQESLRSISGHPLRIRQVSGSAPGLRYASMEPEHSLNTKSSRPVDIVVQFEGSLRWPEDILAIQHTKIAMLSKMAELLEEEDCGTDVTVGLENVKSSFENRAFLGLTLEGVSFRLRIYHDREATQLNRMLKEGSLHPEDRAMAATALSLHKVDFIHGPRHNQAIREACTRTPLLSTTIRLFKNWVSSHLLLPHFRDELLELIACHVFDFPFPYTAPGSLRTAFLRILLFLSKWDWRNEPLLVNVTTPSLTQSKINDIRVDFDAWREIDPGLQRVTLFVASNIDPDGSTWTLGGPSTVAVNRITSLAKAACAEVIRAGATLQAQLLFKHSIEDFDFVVHLSQSAVQQRAGAPFASSGIGLNTKSEYGDEVELVAGALIAELVKAFSRQVAFFHNHGRLPLLGGVWVPRSGVHGMKLASSWLTMPYEDTSERKPAIQINKPEILHQIASIGGDLITRIAVKGNL